MLVKRLVASVAAGVVCGAAGSGQAATLVGSYFFGGTLGSSTAGGPTLVATDPLGTNGFTTATVNGVTRQVYSVTGLNDPVDDQGGLTFNGLGLINNTDGYSVALTFEFVPGATDRDGAWRRIVDSQDRQSDAGLYADFNNQLDVYPNGATASTILAGTFHNVVLTVGPGPNGPVSAYIDSSPALNIANTTALDLQSDDSLNLFLDNVAAGGQGEWAPAEIATAEFYDGVLTPTEAEAFTGNVPVSAAPEPATWATMLLGMFGVGSVLRRSRRIRSPLAA